MKKLKKFLFTSAILFAISFPSFSQISFSHSIGGSIYASESASAPALMYSPRINVVELSDEMTISLGTHLGLGYSGNSREGASSFALDLPIMAEINFGHAANPNTDSSFGGFVGVGYGINKMGSEGAFEDGYNNAAGIVLNAGIRAIINEYPLGARVSYLLNTKDGGENTYSIGIFYTFGSF